MNGRLNRKEVLGYIVEAVKKDILNLTIGAETPEAFLNTEKKGEDLIQFLNELIIELTPPQTPDTPEEILQGHHEVLKVLDTCRTCSIYTSMKTLSLNNDNDLDAGKYVLMCDENGMVVSNTVILENNIDVKPNNNVILENNIDVNLNNNVILENNNVILENNIDLTCNNDINLESNIDDDIIILNDTDINSMYFSDDVS